MTEIFTVGYEGLDPKRFFALLQRCGIEMVVDVREIPVSRKPGFSKTRLSGLCEQHEMGYEHLPELGCPRHIRHEYRDDGDWASYTIQFKAYLETQGDALAKVAKLSDKRRICLLCFEADFNFCHRTYVAQAVAPLVGEHVRISHLTGPIQGRVVELLERAVA